MSLATRLRSGSPRALASQTATARVEHEPRSLLRRLRDGGVAHALLNGLGDGGGDDLGTYERREHLLQVQAQRIAQARVDLADRLRDVADHLGVVAFAVHGDRVDLGQRLGHGASDLRQGAEVHLQDGRLVHLRHGLGLLFEALGLGRQLRANRGRLGAATRLNTLGLGEQYNVTDLAVDTNL